MNARVSELERRLSNLIRPGTVTAADYPNARVRVQIGQNTTAWLPWMTHRAGGDRSWHAPEVGEQVLVLSPCGDLAQGFALPAVYQNAHPAPANAATVHRIEYEDGAVIEYDRQAHKLTATIPGEIVATADGDITVTSQKNIAATATQDITANAQGNIEATCAGSATLQAGQSITIQAAAAITLQAPAITITGEVTQTGGDMTSNGISAQTHMHSGVTTGTETSGPPMM